MRHVVVDMWMFAVAVLYEGQKTSHMNSYNLTESERERVRKRERDRVRKRERERLSEKERERDL